MPRLDLRSYRGMGNEACEDRRSDRRSEHTIAARRDHLRRAIGAAFRWCLKLRAILCDTRAFRHAHHAMVLTVATTAGGQVRLARGR